MDPEEATLLQSVGTLAAGDLLVVVDVSERDNGPTRVRKITANEFINQALALLPDSPAGLPDGAFYLSTGVVTQVA